MQRVPPDDDEVTMAVGRVARAHAELDQVAQWTWRCLAGVNTAAVYAVPRGIGPRLEGISAMVPYSRIPENVRPLAREAIVEAKATNNDRNTIVHGVWRRRWDDAQWARVSDPMQPSIDRRDVAEFNDAAARMKRAMFQLHVIGQMVFAELDEYMWTSTEILAGRFDVIGPDGAKVWDADDPRRANV